MDAASPAPGSVLTSPRSTSAPADPHRNFNRQRWDRRRTPRGRVRTAPPAHSGVTNATAANSPAAPILTGTLTGVVRAAPVAPAPPPPPAPPAAPAAANLRAQRSPTPAVAREVRFDPALPAVIPNRGISPQAPLRFSEPRGASADSTSGKGRGSRQPKGKGKGKSKRGKVALSPNAAPAVQRPWTQR